MLSERRVIHMTRMEMRRQRDAREIEPYLNVSKRDYLSGRNLAGFIAGTFFYGALSTAGLGAALWMYAEEIDRSVALTVLLAVTIGYIVFIFFYRSWYYRRCSEEYSRARKKINKIKSDWDELSMIYQDEMDATRPTVDLNLLFPEGSLGENE